MLRPKLHPRIEADALLLGSFLSAIGPQDVKASIKKQTYKHYRLWVEQDQGMKSFGGSWSQTLNSMR